jgi:hypothetical protein
LIVGGVLGEHLTETLLKAERVRLTRGRAMIIINHPRRAPEGSRHQRQNSSHPPAAPLVLIVGGYLGEHLTKLPLKAKRVRRTRGRATHIFSPPTTRDRGLLTPKTGLFGPTGRSVGIDCWGRPRRTPHGASPQSETHVVNEGTRNGHDHAVRTSSSLAPARGGAGMEASASPCAVS